MGKINKVRHKVKMPTPYPSPSLRCNKEWVESNCPVCLESPHNAVLLLCSSYHKGCRPYMCATNSRLSNCLDQYKKSQENEKNSEQPELLCPLCRGQVKGWTVVKDVRKYFNSKQRSCMQENCSFAGSFQKLKKHMKTKHPNACPRAVDPVLEAKWKRLEQERDRTDVISTIMSSTPGAIVIGDYVLEPHNNNGGNGNYSSDESIASRNLLDLEPWLRLGHFGFLDVESGSPTGAAQSLRNLLFATRQLGRRGSRGR